MTGAPDSDPYNLVRFIQAQEGIFDQAISELESGRKRSHWIWFVFPQLEGLGRSETARHYGIATLDEAKAYLAHPVLGERLRRAVDAVEMSGAASLHALFGSPDDLKFASSMTLFRHAAGAGAEMPFVDALDHWNGGKQDEKTLALLAG